MIKLNLFTIPRIVETAAVLFVCLFVYVFHHHTRYQKKESKSTKNIDYRRSGEEALGETIGLIE